MPEPIDNRSWWRKVFGRSLLKAVVGDFFNSERNTASIIAILLIGTMCYVVVSARQYQFLDTLANVVFAIVGYYFGTKSRSKGDADEED